MRTAIALSLALLAGCEFMDRPALTRFEPGPDPNHWVFVADTDPFWREDKPAAEAARLRWLREQVEWAGACPHGYDVLSRNAYVSNVALSGFKRHQFLAQGTAGGSRRGNARPLSLSALHVYNAECLAPAHVSPRTPGRSSP